MHDFVHACIQELDNIYGMFHTRGILHQKAYQHKTIKAVERMYLPGTIFRHRRLLPDFYFRIADAILDVKGLPLIQVLERLVTMYILVYTHAQLYY